MMNSMSERKHIEWIDGAKGFAILLVIIGHCIDGYKDAELFKQYTFIFNSLHYFIYSFHMPLFFMISGYLFFYAYKNITIKKLIEKLIDLAGVYFLFSSVQVCVQILLQGNINRKLGIENLLMLPIYTVPPYWYLYVLVFLYLLTYSFCNVNLRKLLFITSCVAFVSQFVLIDAFELHNILYYWYFFVVGGYCSSSCLTIKNKANIIILLLLIGYLMNAYCTGFLLKFVNANILSVLSILAFANFKLLKTNKILIICGKYSLPIYLIHCYFTAGTRIILNKLNVDILLIYLILGITLSIAVPIVLYKFCCKYESLSWIFKPSQLMDDMVRR